MQNLSQIEKKLREKLQDLFPQSEIFLEIESEFPLDSDTLKPRFTRIPLISDGVQLGIILIKTPPEAGVFLNFPQAVIDEAIRDVENLTIHERLEYVASEKKRLKVNLKKEEDVAHLHRAQLSVLFEVSTRLGDALNEDDMCEIVFAAISKFVPVSVVGVAIVDGDFVERMIMVHAPEMPSDLLEKVSMELCLDRQRKPDQILPSIQPFLGMDFYDTQLNSFTTIPLAVRDEPVAVLGLGSYQKDLFQEGEINYIHTLANQLSVHLGRLKLQKKMEKSKIKALIQGMAEGVIMFDDHHHLELINPGALEMLALGASVSVEDILAQFEVMGVRNRFEDCIQTDVDLVDIECHFLSQILLMSVIRIREGDHTIGTVVTFKNFTEIYKSNEIKDHRLEVMSQASKIINTLTDMNNLLSYIMDFILMVFDTDLGSIMVKKGARFETKIHANFPDKVREDYRLITGQSITDYVIETRQLFVVDQYMTNDCVQKNPKVPLDYFICLPILVKGELIAIISVAQRYRESRVNFSVVDAETTKVISVMIGTAILNARLYQETLVKQKMDEELRIANEIQRKLLPDKLPVISGIDVGALTIPAREIGGDYYDFFELDNGHLGIILADIVGKGVPAGLFMAMLKSILHSHLHQITSPKEALIVVNRILFKDQVINKFVPIFYAIYDPESKVLKYSNSGHEPAVFFHQNKCTTLDTPGFPLGGYSDCEVEENALTLEEGDRVLFFTDGVPEARNSDGVAFGYEAIERELETSSQMSAEETVQLFGDSLKSYIDDATQHDDITLVMIHAGIQSKSEHNLLESKRIKVNSDKCHIKTIREEVAKIAEKIGFNSEDVFNIKLAINEAHANVIQHSYAGKSVGEIVFKFMGYDDRLEIVIKDFVPGADQRSTKGEDKLAELEGSGLGVFLMQSVMDSVRYQRSDKLGTELIMIKYLKPKGE